MNPSELGDRSRGGEGDEERLIVLEDAEEAMAEEEGFLANGEE